MQSKQLEEYSKPVQFIGYWLYLFVRLFKRTSKPKLNKFGQFASITSGINLPKLKDVYRNKQGLFCIDYQTNGYTLTVGDGGTHLLLRIFSSNTFVDKEILLTLKTNAQEVSGVINSMIITLRDKDAKELKRVMKGLMEQ